MIDLLYMQQEFILTIYKLLYFNARDGYRSACFCYKWDIFLKRLSFFRERRRWTWCKSFHGIDYKPQLLTIIASRDYSFTANFNRVSSHWREGQMGSTPLGRPLSHWPTLVSFTFLLNSYSAWKLKFLEEIVRDRDLFLTAENTIDQILYMDVHFLCYLHITELIKKCSGFSVMNYRPLQLQLSKSPF